MRLRYLREKTTLIIEQPDISSVYVLSRSDECVNRNPSNCVGYFGYHKPTGSVMDTWFNQSR